MGVSVGGLSIVRARTPVVESFDFTALSENPLSLSGRVYNGLADGLDWNNIKSISGKGATGTASQDPAVTGYTDSICGITAPSGQAYSGDQDLIGRIGINAANQATFSGFHEVELCLRVTKGAHSWKMYEVLFSVGPTNYFEIVRWRGPKGNSPPDGSAFVSLALNNSTAPTVSNGHYLRATMFGTIITGYHKTTLGGSWAAYVTHDIVGDDEQWRNGDIGMGNWDNGNPGNFDDYWWETLQVSA